MKKINNITIKITALFFIMSLVLSVGICMTKIQNEVGMKVFDLKLTYNYEYVIEFINNASQETIDFYRNIQIPVDFFLAIMLGLFPLICFLYFKEKIFINNIFIISAIGITILDISENILLFLILGNSLNKGIANFSGVITLIKNICMYSTYLYFIYTVVNYKLSSKKKDL